MNETCDHCRHRAYFRVIGPGGQLTLCRHYFMKNELELRYWATEVEDYSAILFNSDHPTAVPVLVSVADPDDEEAEGVEV